MSDRITIQSNGNFGYTDRNFYMEIQDAVLKGYRVAYAECPDTYSDVSLRNLNGNQGYVVMYKEGTDPCIKAPHNLSKQVEQKEPEVVEEVKEVIDTPKPEQSKRSPRRGKKP